MSDYTWEIDKLPLSTDSDLTTIIAVLNQREVEGWDLAQMSTVNSHIVFFWRSKEKT